ncbi:BadF/BadG/BcrA/BcrD ATPase family protein [Paenibacillus oryzisoli]|uniref:ATPase BadF/BadG/BcrA/BcrD type domain-containing protein n=1 Tax=Paenibacillus oryzisoli TaxID=1850517 RepID=A0A198AGP1_9BACL|nr:BadF/BadG/BcrA/BcrD ATPase family protein [Paenibacillus oryzisoli]OAS20664.1 hypothetical protein A8708_19170 [Paenibacillus oryzisoli]
MQKNIVIGIDGGGTHTRAVAVDTTGHVLAHSRSGAANLHKDPHAKQHVRAAIANLLAKVGCNEGDIISLVAGFAGLDRTEDQAWCDDFIDIDGMNGTKRAVSDAWIAQVGAVGGEPGIIAISGTGSVVFGINENGEQLRNYDFRQYASSTARHLSYETVYRILAGSYDLEDEELITKVFTYWGVSDMQEFGKLASTGFISDHQSCNMKFGDMAQLVTVAAATGSPLAIEVCNSGVSQLITAVRLVGSQFASDCIRLALIGSVARSPYMMQRLENEIAKANKQGKSYAVQQPRYEPVTGAILMAFQQAGIDITDEIHENLGLST